jgi:PilZ domain
LQYGCNIGLAPCQLNCLVSTQVTPGLLAAVLHVNGSNILGVIMTERRKARRYEVYLPVQVCMAKKRPIEFYTGQLRDVSRSGIYFHSNIPLEEGAGLELTFALPAEKERSSSVLVRASARALRSSALPGEVSPLYGVAAAIDRIDFVRPVSSAA